MRNLHLLLLLLSLIGFATAQMPIENKDEHNDKWQWLTKNNYRVIIKCSSIKTPSKHKYAWIEMDFSQFYAQAASPKQILNPDSIRVIRYDEKTGKPIKYDDAISGENAYYVPSKIDEWQRRHITQNNSRLPQLSWLRKEAGESVYICYFDFAQDGEQQRLPKPAFIGTGDALSFGTIDEKATVRGVPLIIDWDGDGNKDIITSLGMVPEKAAYFYKNLGDSFNDAFAKPISIDIQYQQETQLNIANKRGVQVTDVNGDGNDDFVSVGGYFSDVRRNGFTRWVTIDFDLSSDIGQILKDSRSYTWNIADWDGDGVNDLIVSNSYWKEYGWSNAFNDSGRWINGPLRGWFYLFKNIGSNEDFKLAEPEQIFTLDGNCAEIYGTIGLAVADFTGDGLLDIVAGDFIDNIHIFVNIGSKGKPLLAPRKRLMTTEGLFEADYQAISVAADDYDNDGYMDLFIRGENDYVGFIENTGTFTNDGMPVFKPVRYLKCFSDYPVEGQLPVISVADWNRDGKQDIIFGNSPGDIGFYEQISEYPDLKFGSRKLFEDSNGFIRIIADWNGSIQGPAEKKWGYTVPCAGDWDGDGYPDIILNSIWGHILWYKNTKISHTHLEDAQAVQVQWDNDPPKPVWRWWNPKPNDWSTQWRSTVQMIDWDSDGLTDAAAMDWEGYLVLHKRYIEDGEMKLSAGKRIFLDEKGEPWQINPKKPGGCGRRKFVFTDWNDDGKWDLIVDDKAFGGNVVLYLNESDNDNPRFVSQGAMCDIIVSGHTCSPAVLDVDGDGELDLLLAAEDGHFYCFHRSYIEDKSDLKASFLYAEETEQDSGSVMLFDEDIAIGQIIGGKIVAGNAYNGEKSIYAAVDKTGKFNLALDFRGNINILQNTGLVVYIKVEKDAKVEHIKLDYMLLYAYRNSFEPVDRLEYYPHAKDGINPAKFAVDGRRCVDQILIPNDGKWHCLTVDLNSGMGLPHSKMFKGSNILRRMDFIFHSPAKFYMDNVYVSD